MNHNLNYVVIMAGGIGSRFWPMSTEQRPKQFIDMLGTGRTLFQHTVDRFANLCPPENIIVVTADRYAGLVKEQYPLLPHANILTEPCMRNTAPCIAYASYKIRKANPRASMVVSPADHLITDTTLFAKTVGKGLNFVESHPEILTLGIQPRHPATGYGYIHVKDRDREISGVTAFKEKPDYATARHYLNQGGFLWNSGIFMWSVQTIISAFERYNPALAETFEKGTPFYNTEKEQTFIDEVYPACENISIDYSILEKAGNLYVQKADFDWSDLGTWSALWEQSEKTVDGNACSSPATAFYESRDNIVNTPLGKKVIVQGLTDYIIVEAGNTLLICSKKEEQRIKNFLNDSMASK